MGCKVSVRPADEFSGAVAPGAPPPCRANRRRKGMCAAPTHRT
eukprot:gene17021-16631_t